MHKKMTWLTLVILLGTTLLGACSPGGPTAAPQNTQAINNPGNATATEAVPTTTPTATLAPATATPIPSPTATEVPKAYGPDNFPSDVDPLTGLKVSDPTLLDRRPLAVKVQMIPRGERPPWGVSKADIVYDYYQNFGATRLFAVFYGQDAEEVGPIRSARLLDGPLVSMYQAIFAFGSADQRILNRLFNSTYADRLILQGSQDCPPMCRVDPNGPNYLVTNTAELSKYAVAKNINNDRPTLNGMSFDPQTPSAGEPGQRVYVRFNFNDYNRWDYNTTSGRYLRFQDSADDNGGGEQYVPLLDKSTGQQIAADNVVVLFVSHEYAFNTRAGLSEIVQINLNGTGKAYAFRDGKAYPVTWNAENGKVLYLTNADGTPYQYKPGNTWYQIVGLNSKIENQLPGDMPGYRFTFSFQ
ncbi:MAG: DUF3048 domain-containing protein [Anaerolineales bacterium]